MAGKTALGGKKNEEADGVQEQEEGINCAQTTATASVGVAVSDNGVTANVVEVNWSHSLAASFVSFVFSLP